LNLKETLMMLSELYTRHSKLIKDRFGAFFERCAGEFEPLRDVIIYNKLLVS